MVLRLDKIAGLVDVSTTSRAYPGYTCVDGFQDESPCTRDECISLGMRTGTKRADIRCDHCPDVKVKYLCESKFIVGCSSFCLPHQ